MGFLMCLCIFFVFLAMFMGFLKFLCFCWYAHGFFDVFAPLGQSLAHFDAMFMGFLILLCFCCYAHGFFDVFANLFRFRCHVHGFFDFLCVFAGMLMGFFMCLHPLIILLLCSCVSWSRFVFDCMFICVLIVFAPLSDRLLKSLSPII